MAKKKITEHFKNLNDTDHNMYNKNTSSDNKE